MQMKVWSKFAPGMTALVVSDPDYRGLSLAMVTDDVQSPGGPFAAVINLIEWSDTEIVPVPESVPDQLWIAFTGTDPAILEYQIFDSEIKAAVFVSHRKDSFGYTPVLVQRLSMIPNIDRE